MPNGGPDLAAKRRVHRYPVYELALALRVLVFSSVHRNGRSRERCIVSHGMLGGHRCTVRKAGSRALDDEESIPTPTLSMTMHSQSDNAVI